MLVALLGGVRVSRIIGSERPTRVSFSKKSAQYRRPTKFRKTQLFETINEFGFELPLIGCSIQDELDYPNRKSQPPGNISYI